MPDDFTSYEQYFFTPDKTYLKNPAFYIGWAGHRVCDHSHMIGPRVLDTYKLVFILSGQGYIIQDDNPVIHLKTNDMFILFSCHRHHYWADPEDPWTIIWATFNGADSMNLLNSLNVTLSRYTLRNALTDSIKKSMFIVIKSLGDETDPYRLNSISEFFQVINKLRMNFNHIPPPTEIEEESLSSQLMIFIEQNYYMEVDMKMICQHFHYSRSYLSRTFRHETQITIQQFLQETRVNKAKHLLLETNLLIKEISTSVGINDALYFSKLFNKIAGCSPREYRNKGLESIE